MTDATPAYSGPERILSGMQPTGGLHLGNYLGALKNWVPMQDSGKECFFCAVDMHAMTVEYDPAVLPDRVRGVAAAYIAAGVDPKRSAIFATKGFWPRMKGWNGWSRLIVALRVSSRCTLPLGV